MCRLCFRKSSLRRLKRKEPGEISLLIAFAVLIAGYFLYGRVTDRIFAADDRQTPAIAVNDGVDCVPMKTWKAFLVQLLNIAGTGPIFGSLLTAIPAAFMSAVSMTYILTAKEGLRLPIGLACWLGGAFAVVLFGMYCILWARSRRSGRTGIGAKEEKQK